MADHALTQVDRIAIGSANGMAALTPGDTYTFTLNGGRYQLITKSSAYGTGGILLGRIMQDGTTLLNHSTISADGDPVIEVGAGKFRITVPADANAGTLIMLSPLPKY